MTASKDLFCIRSKNMAKEVAGKKGLVMRSTGSWYTVETEGGELLECRIKGKFRTKGLRTTNPVAVGDVVYYEMVDETAVITAIEPRKNYIIRKSVNLSKEAHIIAANIDRAFLIVTLAEPPTSNGFIDRFLVTAEAYSIPVTIVFNKTDLYGPEEMELLELYTLVYREIGYEIMQLSATNATDVEAFRQQLTDQVNLLSGHSGVGKSTLINGVEPELTLKTADVSGAHKKGRHTTTFAEMFSLSEGGYIIDTPGIKGFGMVDMEKEELSHYFPEMRQRMHACKFHNCLHLNEPKCAVKAALETGEIAPWRYDNYFLLYHEDVNDTYR